jgi:hypothetical protein
MPDRTKAEYEQLYKGERTEAGQDPLFLNPQWNEGGQPQYTRVRTLGAESNAEVDPGAEGTGAQSSEESEIRKEKIPASYQQIIKKYFESVENND